MPPPPLPDFTKTLGPPNPAAEQDALPDFTQHLDMPNETPVTRRKREAREQLKRDFGTTARRPDPPGLTQLVHGGPEAWKQAFMYAAGRGNPTTQGVFATGDLSNRALASVGGVTEEVGDWMDRQFGTTPPINAPPWLTTALKYMGHQGAANALQQWDDIAKHPKKATGFAGDVAQSGIYLPGVEGIASVRDLMEAISLSHAYKIPLGEAARLLKVGKAPVSEHLHAANEITSAGHSVLGIKPEQAHANWTRYTYDYALAPLGEKYLKNGPIGNEGFNQLKKYFKRAYDSVYPKVRVVMTKGPRDPLRQRWDKLTAEVRGSLDQPHIGKFLRLRRDIESRFNQYGVMRGNNYQTVVEKLRDEAARLRRSSNPFDHDLADFLVGGTHEPDTDSSLLSDLRAAAKQETPPEVFERLGNIDRGYARFARIQDATEAASVDSAGRFTPTQLISASGKGARRVGARSAFASGTAVMQHQGRMGQEALPSLERPSWGERFMQHAPAFGAGGAAGALLSEFGPLAHHIGSTAGFMLGGLGTEAANQGLRLARGRREAQMLLDQARRRAAVEAGLNVGRTVNRPAATASAVSAANLARQKREQRRAEQKP